MCVHGKDESRETGKGKSLEGEKESSPIESPVRKENQNFGVWMTTRDQSRSVQQQPRQEQEGGRASLSMLFKLLSARAAGDAGRGWGSLAQAPRYARSRNPRGGTGRERRKRGGVNHPNMDRRSRPACLRCQKCPLQAAAGQHLGISGLEAQERGGFLAEDYDQRARGWLALG